MRAWHALFYSVIALQVGATLVACATAPPAPPIVQCVPVKPMTPMAQALLGQQLAKLSAADPTFADSPVSEAIQDYGAMRAAARACQTAATPPKQP